MSVADVLRTEKVTRLDLSEYVTIESGKTVRDSVQKMQAANRNCAFVLKERQLVGIFTDRDVLRVVVDRPEIWDHPIDDVMTHTPKTVNANQRAGDALEMMDTLRFRNVPVLSDDGTVVGNLTHFALIRYLADLFPKEVYNLPPTPDQFGEDRYGG